MSDLVALAERLRALERRIERAEAMEHGHSEYLLASGARVGATAQAQTFGYPLVAPALLPAVSAHPDSELFVVPLASTPPRWTQVDSAVSSNTTTPGFWSLGATSTNTTWKFRRQVAPFPAGNHSCLFGPLLFRDARWAENVTYRFGVIAGDGGVADESIFLRAVLEWDALTALWRIRAERGSEGVQTNSVWLNLSSNPYIQPVFMRVIVGTPTGTANSSLRAYFGSHWLPYSQTMMRSWAIPAYAWGDSPFLQMELASRGAGVNDILYLGGISRTADS